jgi:hypothetical protein
MQIFIQTSIYKLLTSTRIHLSMSRGTNYSVKRNKEKFFLCIFDCKYKTKMVTAAKFMLFSFLGFYLQKS